MTAAGDLLNQVVPTLVRIARRPGAVLLSVAGLNVGLFATLGLLHGFAGASWSAWVPLVLAVLLAVPVVVLAVRRHRLQRQTAGLGSAATVTVLTGEVTVVGPSGRADPLRAELDTMNAAMAEGTLRTARFLPRVEAAQRAARVAAGGPVHAPYLRDDLRITIAALIGTLVAVPLSILGWIVTAVALLA